MSAQFRASAEDWRAIESHTTAHNYNCIRELRDRVLCMDACIRDIYDTLDTLNKRCDRNYIKASEIEARIEEPGQPTPAAGEGSLLAQLEEALYHQPTQDWVKVVILAVADWLENGECDPIDLAAPWNYVAQLLRREVES